MRRPCNKFGTSKDAADMIKSAGEYQNARSELEKIILSTEYSAPITDKDTIEKAIADEMEHRKSRDSDIRKAKKELIESGLYQPQTEEDKKVQRDGNNLQGAIGERVVAQLAKERMDLVDIGFTPPKAGGNGIDNIFRDNNGVFCIVESKFTDEADGRISLDKSQVKRESDGEPVRQGSRTWTSDHIDTMVKVGDKVGAQNIERMTNGLIAKEIQDAGMDNVRRILMHVNPRTLTAIAFEDKGSNDWQPISMWKWRPDSE